GACSYAPAPLPTEVRAYTPQHLCPPRCVLIRPSTSAHRGACLYAPAPLPTEVRAYTPQHLCPPRCVLIRPSTSFL
ncbi:unnamed protein product, partial [Closterium sp. Naga37s-1]